MHLPNDAKKLSKILSFVIVALTSHFCSALRCAHYKDSSNGQGLCNATGHPVAWCHFDGLQGTYSCDYKQTCSKIMDLPADKTTFAGCHFDIDCCCTGKDYCNYVFVQQKEPLRTQMCKNEMESTFITENFQSCRDSWCYAVRFNVWQQDTEERRYLYMHKFFEKSCGNIMWRGENRGKSKGCLTITHTDHVVNKTFTGEVCCCRGRDFCNAELFIGNMQKTGDGAATLHSKETIFSIVILIFALLSINTR